jgi:hypothetical protein
VTQGTAAKKPKPTHHRIRYWQRELRQHELATGRRPGQTQPMQCQANIVRARALAMGDTKFVNMTNAGDLEPAITAAAKLLRNVRGASLSMVLQLGYVIQVVQWRNVDVEGAPRFSGLAVKGETWSRLCGCSVDTISRNWARFGALGLTHRVPWFDALGPSSKGGGVRQSQEENLILPGELLSEHLGIRELKLERRKTARKERQKRVRAASNCQPQIQDPQLADPTARETQPTVVSLSGAAALRNRERELWTKLSSAAERMRLSARKVRPLSRPRKAVTRDDAAAALELARVVLAGEVGGAAAPPATRKRRTSGASGSAGKRSRRSSGAGGARPRGPGGPAVASGALTPEAIERLAFAAVRAAIGGRPAAARPLELVAKFEGDGGAAALDVASPPEPDSQAKTETCKKSKIARDVSEDGRHTTAASSSSSSRSSSRELDEDAWERRRDRPNREDAAKERAHRSAKRTERAGFQNPAPIGGAIGTLLTTLPPVGDE